MDTTSEGPPKSELDFGTFAKEVRKRVESNRAHLSRVFDQEEAKGNSLYQKNSAAFFYPPIPWEEAVQTVGQQDRIEFFKTLAPHLKRKNFSAAGVRTIIETMSRDWASRIRSEIHILDSSAQQQEKQRYIIKAGDEEIEYVHDREGEGAIHIVNLVRQRGGGTFVDGTPFSIRYSEPKQTMASLILIHSSEIAVRHPSRPRNAPPNKPYGALSVLGHEAGHLYESFLVRFPGTAIPGVNAPIVIPDTESHSTTYQGFTDFLLAKEVGLDPFLLDISAGGAALYERVTLGI